MEAILEGNPGIDESNLVRLDRKGAHVDSGEVVVPRSHALHRDEDDFAFALYCNIRPVLSGRTGFDRAYRLTDQPFLVFGMHVAPRESRAKLSR